METILKSITFNKSLIWDKRFKDIYLATTVQELLEIFKLRSEVYTQLNYDDEFPDLIQGFNCDSYDENSAILYTKVNGTITGTCRVIFDSQNKLPIDSYFSLDYLRTDMKTLVEVSRLIVKYFFFILRVSLVIDTSIYPWYTTFLSIISNSTNLCI